MPIKKRVSQRPGFTPFVYFKGTTYRAKRIPSAELEKQFLTAGYPLTDVKKLRTDLADAIKNLNNRRPTYLLFVDTQKGKMAFLLRLFPKTGKILIRQQPAAHGVTGRGRLGSFVDLLKILKEGFRGNTLSNIELYHERRRMAWPIKERSQSGIVAGDSYSIELMEAFSNVQSPNSNETDLGLNVQKADPSKILRINIVLDESASEETIERKISYYKERLKGWSVHFIKPKK